MRATIVDTETTGANPEVDQVVELASIELPATPAEFMRADILKMPMAHGYFGHTAPMQWGAQSTHHIDPETLVGLVPYKDEFAEHWDHQYIIGHNIDFDAEMLDCMGLKRICTLALARYLMPELDSHTQSTMLYVLAHYKGFGAPWASHLLKNAHSADADVLNCARVLKFLIGKAGIKFETWDDVYQFSELARTPTHMTFGKHKGKLIKDVDPSWIGWYRGTDNQDPYVIKAFELAGL